MSGAAPRQTPWQTVGPFFHYALPRRGGADLVGGEGDLGARPDLVPEGHDLLGSARGDRVAAAKGEPIDIAGAVYDGDGQPVPDAMVEIWQAGPDGRYASAEDARGEPPLDETFLGFGRSSTSPEGEFRFRTLKPGRVAGPGNSLQAPHIAVGVLGRGLMKRLVTRLYFADEPSNAEDPILALAPAERRDTLIARKDGAVWRFDIRLQGEGETVFFDI
jgi:protocatechuate 3,4-dioxygenase alpha subunit